MPVSAPSPVKVTRELIHEFLTLAEERKELDRRSRLLSSRIEPIKSALAELLSATGKESCVRHGYRLTFIEGRVTVSWKDEFVKIAGPDLAERVLQQAPRSKQLDVKLANPPS